MSRDLLHYYERELAWLKQAGGDFARAHPAIASNLLPEDGNSDDPHMARLLEGVAFLNARIQQQLDGDFQEITDALLEHLYPHYLAPLPSMTIVEMTAPAGLERAVTIPARSAATVQGVTGINCQYSTVYPVTLLPYQLTSARLQPRPFRAPGADGIRDAAAVLTLQFSTQLPDFSLAGCGIDHLRFFLRAPTQYAWRLHELLTCHCVHIAVAHGESDPTPFDIATHNLRLTGFGADETLLPASAGSQPAYHCLTEFFHFPAKFLFLDLHGIAAASARKPGNFSVFIYLDSSDRDLERNLTADFFSLTATPAVNLFAQIAEPISLLPHRIDYPLIPDIRAIDAYEVYAIEKVECIDTTSGKRTMLQPFFGLTHDGRHDSQFWHHRRQLVRRGSSNEPGFDSFIAFSDPSCNAVDSSAGVMHISLLCSNRNLPSKLTSSELPRLQLRHNPGRVQEIRALLMPTTVVRAELGNGARNRLLSQLNLNLMGLIDQADVADSLRKMLRLYDHGNSATTRALIDAIDRVECNAGTAQLRYGKYATQCRGIDICITLDEKLLAGTSLMLYVTVLEHFLAQSVSINSFVRVSAKLRGREEIFKRGPARPGTRPLL